MPETFLTPKSEPRQVEILLNKRKNILKEMEEITEIEKWEKLYNEAMKLTKSIEKAHELERRSSEAGDPSEDIPLPYGLSQPLKVRRPENTDKPVKLVMDSSEEEAEGWQDLQVPRPENLNEPVKFIAESGEETAKTNRLFDKLNELQKWMIKEFGENKDIIKEISLMINKAKQMGYEEANSQTKITKNELEAMIEKNNKEHGTNFRLGGAYGQYELWNGDKDRLEAGSIKDCYNMFVKVRFQEKYTTAAIKQYVIYTDAFYYAGSAKQWVEGLDERAVLFDSAQEAGEMIERLGNNPDYQIAEVEIKNGKPVHAFKAEKWVIRDWMNNKVFDDQEFDSFEAADEFLNEFVEKEYPETKNNEKLFVETKDEYWIKEKATADTFFSDIKGTEPGLKDLRRMEDIKFKAAGDKDKMEQLVDQMANAITDREKAIRRAKAAEKVFKSGFGKEMAKIFLNRAKALSSITTAEVEARMQDWKKVAPALLPDGHKAWTKEYKADPKYGKLRYYIGYDPKEGFDTAIIDKRDEPIIFGDKMFWDFRDAEEAVKKLKISFITVAAIITKEMLINKISGLEDHFIQNVFPNVEHSIGAYKDLKDTMIGYAKMAYKPTSGDMDTIFSNFIKDFKENEMEEDYHGSVAQVGKPKSIEETFTTEFGYDELFGDYEPREDLEFENVVSKQMVLKKIKKDIGKDVEQVKVKSIKFAGTTSSIPQHARAIYQIIITGPANIIEKLTGRARAQAGTDSAMTGVIEFYSPHTKEGVIDTKDKGTFIIDGPYLNKTEGFDPNQDLTGKKVRFDAKLLKGQKLAVNVRIQDEKPRDRLTEKDLEEFTKKIGGQTKLPTWEEFTTEYRKFPFDAVIKAFDSVYKWGEEPTTWEELDEFTEYIVDADEESWKHIVDAVRKIKTKAQMEDELKKGTKLRIKENFLISILEGSEARGLEVKEGNILEIIGKWSPTWYEVKLLTKADFMHTPGLSGKRFQPYQAKIDNLRLGISKMDINRVEVVTEAQIEDEPDEENDIFIHPTGPLGSKYSVNKGGEHIGEFSESEEMEKAIKEWMEHKQYWPNVWNIDDHGGIELYKMEAQAQSKMTAQELSKKLETEIQALYPNAYISTQFDPGWESVTLFFATTQKDGWPHGIIHNDPAYHIVHFHGFNKDGTVKGEKIECTLSMGGSIAIKNFSERTKLGWRSKTDTIDKVYKHVINYFTKAKPIIEEKLKENAEYNKE